MRRQFIPSVTLAVALGVLAQSSLSAQFVDSGLVKTARGGYFCIWNGSACSGHAYTWSFPLSSFTAVSPVPTISPLSSDPHVHTANPLTTMTGTFDFNGDGWADAPYDYETLSLLDVGVYHYQFNCTYTFDGQTLYTCVPVPLSVVVFNKKPTAAISTSGTTGIGHTITLNANSSDPDSGAVSNHWRLQTSPSGHAGTLATPSAASTPLTFVDERDIGSWTVAVDVDDNEGERRTFTKSFTIPNLPPSISIVGETQVPALEDIDLSTSTTVDPDGGPPLTLTWDIVSAPPGASLGPQSNFSHAASIGWTTAESDIGTWKFRLIARDNENATDTALVEVHVTNLLPVITFDRPGPYEVPQGTTFTLTNTTPDDPDGGAVTHDWTLIQSPIAAGALLGAGFSQSPTLTLATGPHQVGTWIWMLHMRDNEGGEDSAEVQLLVDAPVQAAVTGPDKQNMLQDFVVDGRGSLDPDSPPDSVPHNGHQSSRPTIALSPGIVSYVWSFVDIPAEAWGEYVTGPVEYSIHATNGGPTLSVDAAELRPGTWTFGLHVVDGEGNEDDAEVSVLILDPNAPPVAIVPTVTYGLTDISGNILTDIGTNAAQSFDLDNLLTSPYAPGLGITNYAWQVIDGPPSCLSLPASVSGPTEVVYRLFGAGSTIAPECIGTWLARVTVTDDEPPGTALTGRADGAVVMANCPGEVCIDYPTTLAYQYVEFADNTDVTIAYHLNSVLYNNPIFASGARLEMSIFHESDATIPVYTGQFDYDMLSLLVGGRPTAHWSGYTNGGLRPLPGKYSVQLRVTNPLTATPFAEAVQPLSIWLEVVDVAIDATTSDRYVSTTGLKSGDDHFHLNFTATGHFATTANYDEAKLRVTSVATSTVVATVNIPSPLSGTVSWDGELVAGSGIYLPAGDYRADVEVLKAGHSLGRSAPLPFTAYAVTVDVAGTPAAQRWTPGATFVMGGPARDVTVTVTPAPVGGQLTVATLGFLGDFEFKDGATAVATAGAGAVFPVTFLSTPKIFQVRSLVPATSATELHVSYLPPGAAPAKTATDSAQLFAFDLELAALCSDTVRAATNGIFVERAPVAVSAATFSEMRLLMYPLRVQADRVLDPAATDVTLDIEAGGANVALYAGGAAYVPLGLSKTWHAADFDQATQRLDIPVLVAGVARGEATLRLRYLKGGAEIRVRRVKIRVGDLPGLAGRAVPVAPRFLFGRVYNLGTALTSALDPSRYADRVGRRAAAYVLPHHARAVWAGAPSLVGAVAGPVPVTVTAGGLAANLAALGAALPAGDYDVVYDFGSCSLNGPFASDGRLDPGDISDALALDAPSLSVLSSAIVLGPNAVATAEYGVAAPITTTTVTADAAHPYDGLDTTYAFRLRGQLVYPNPLPAGVRPLIVIAHGNHAPLVIPGLGPTPPEYTTDENYRGYTYLQTLLASHGYVTLSVDLDEMYGGGGTLPTIGGGGIVLRGNVILRNITEVLTNPAIAGGALTGRIDITRVYLMGHSRGGEATLAAFALNDGSIARPPGSPAYTAGVAFRALMSVSPVSAKTVSLPGTTPFFLLYGSADGDVNGANIGVQPFTHVDRAQGPAHTIYAIGANHNYFNTSWGFSDASERVVCAPACAIVPLGVPVGANLRTRPEQQELFQAYAFAFLMRYDRGLLPWGAYFDTPPSILRPLGAPLAIPLTGSTKRAAFIGGSTVIDNYELLPVLNMASSGATVTVGVADSSEVRLADTNLVNEAEPANRFFQATSGVVFNWTTPSVYEFTPGTPFDLNGATVAFRISQQPRHARTTGLNAPLDLAVTLVDTSGHTSSVTIGAWDRIHEEYRSRVGGTETTKAMLETRAIPWWAFVANGSTVDLANIASIRFQFGIPGTSAQGRVAIDDVEIWR